MTARATAPDWSAGTSPPCCRPWPTASGVQPVCRPRRLRPARGAAHRRRARRRPRPRPAAPAQRPRALPALAPASAARRVPCGFPTTTATSMGSLRHRAAAGAHGLVGMQVLDPATDRLSTSCRGRTGPTRVRWQPHETVFEAAEDAGVAVTMVGPWYFKGSGLTTAALRGGGFRSGTTLDDRVDAAVVAVRATRALARLPLLGRGRQGRPRARLPVVAVGRRGRGRRRRPAPARRPRARRHVDRRHGRPRHGRRAVRRPHRPGARARAHARHTASRRGAALPAALHRGRRAATPWPAVAARGSGDAAHGPARREQLLDEGWFGPVRPRSRPASATSS